MPDILLGLIWIQTDCKGYQQKTKVATSGERVKTWAVKIIILIIFVNFHQNLTKAVTVVHVKSLDRWIKVSGADKPTMKQC